MKPRIRAVASVCTAVFLYGCVSLSSAGSNPTKNRFDFQIADQEHITTVDFNIVGFLDSDFLQPMTTGRLDVRKIDTQLAYKSATLLLDREVRVGSKAFGVLGDLGVAFGVRRNLAGSKLTVDQLQRDLQAEITQDIKYPKNPRIEPIELDDAQIVKVGTEKYSYIKIEAMDLRTFTEIYSFPIHNGYYGQLFFNFVSNDPARSRTSSGMAADMVRQIMETVSIGRKG